MPSRVAVKICGLKTAQAIDDAVAAGAAYVGLNFFPPSPRSVTIEQAASLALAVPPGVAKVGLVVDADDALLDAIVGGVALDFLQLHGHETPSRVGQIKARYGLPVIKVVGLSGPDDLPQLDSQMQVADQILVDSKPPKGAALPGGNGLAFDWQLIAGRRWPVPWMLAGGLTPDNVALAVARTGALQVDVSSGVETAPGVKDPYLVAAFVRNAQETGSVPDLRK